MCKILIGNEEITNRLLDLEAAKQHLQKNVAGKKVSLYTHSGKFHCDDVLSYVLMKYCLHILGNTSLDFHRVNAISFICNDFGCFISDDINTSIVFDIGGGILDHHNNEQIERSNGIQLAAAGRIGYLYLRPVLCLVYGDEQGNKIFASIDQKLIQYVDSGDTRTGDPQFVSNPLTMLVGTYMPTWNSDNSIDSCFYTAANAVESMFLSLIKSEISKVMLEEKALQLISECNEEYIILDRFMPIEKYCIPSNIVYIIYPSVRTEGYWCVKTVSSPESTPDRLLNKKLFPISFVGNDHLILPAMEELPFNICFGHHARFIIECPSLDDAIRAAKYALIAPIED